MAEEHTPNGYNARCPIPVSGSSDRITLAHGEGGKLMRQLIADRIVPALTGAELLRHMDDAARLPDIGGRPAVSTDSFVVSPLFFPGGDIGSLAVHGTVNDLAVSGARPMYLTLSLILEEGLHLSVLDAVLHSVADASAEAQVQVVAGDTKVVPRGAADGLFINTTGVGRWIEPVPRGPTTLVPGDVVIVSGPIGRHGIAVLCAREELDLHPPPISDCAPLHAPAAALVERLGGRLRCMRDATRGGVAAVLHEWAQACGGRITIEESLVPISPPVRGACELLGLDPLHVANEGTMVIAVAPQAVEEALETLQSFAQTAEAARIGEVQPNGLAPVTIRRLLGGERPLDEPLGAALPRIC
ncbi:MAG: hydrogenase expression/formation protein HypE [Planctomycetota bacterium]|nr:MAG: hydrogenase expression/formation protein HypE [Planctomycetota bacterium]